MSTLAQVSERSVLEDMDKNIDVYEVLDRSPDVALQFDYLRARESLSRTREPFITR